VLLSLTRSPLAAAAGIGLFLLALGPASGSRPSAGPNMLGPTASPTAHTASYDVHDPATWSNRALAAQLTISCVDVHDVRAARHQAQEGIGGITLLGSSPDHHLASRLGAARRAAPHDVAPFVMSDEEGGEVQRLRSAIYPLPSAKTMGGWHVAHVQKTAAAYATRMRALGVRMDLAPVSDLAVPGAFIASEHRAFSPDPDRVAALARAWRLGMAGSGVATVLKHWPGHGSAKDSHNGPARVPPLATLEKRDLRPFDTELSRGARVVMVGHLMSKGLTEPGLPASESPRALAYLRAKAGPDVVIMTDALNMAAASTSLQLTPAGAAVRALRAGADWALICGAHPIRAIATVSAAISSGRLPRAQAVASARRIVALKSSFGLAPR
jgi:beta-N-acetylhexosaminidase